MSLVVNSYNTFQLESKKTPSITLEVFIQIITDEIMRSLS